METNMNESNGRADDVRRAAHALRRGGVALFPTDTVAGVGVAVGSSDSPKALADLKGRPSDKPIAWLVGGPVALDAYGAAVPGYARRMAQKWWPGGLTLIVHASPAVPRAFCSKEGTIGLRMPDCERVLDLIARAGSPLATTSANLSGEPSPRCVADVSAVIRDKVDAIVGDGSAAESGVASTVVDCTGAYPVVVREGDITSADIERLLLTDDSVCETRDVSFASADGLSTISARLWFPPACAPDSGVKPRGVVHIVHGMAEHVRRYDDFARYLVGHGFVVCGSDMIGHGKSAASKEDLGHIPVRAGRSALVADVQSLREIVSARYPVDTPYLVFGHSMGSFITRAYIAEHGAGLAAAVLCGTGSPAPVASAAGNVLSRVIARVRGERYRSSLVDSLAAGGFGKQIPDARTPLDWLSVNSDNVDAYLADEYCGAMFSVGAYSTLTDLTRWVVSQECASHVPNDLPVLFIAGDQDPVGDCGQGVHQAAELLRSAGVERVDERIFANMRHEILNETDRMNVFTFVSQWMEALL